ncbi:MAG: serine protease [Holophagaceae bacterium]|nr:serine protease [Holophagaceae bacterium]
MKHQVKQVVGLSFFASACMAVGMGLSHGWVAQAQEEKPIAVSARGFEGLPPIAEVAEKLNPAVVAITNTSIIKGQAQGGSPFGQESPFDWFFGPNQRRRAPGAEEEQRVQGGGSGVIISSDGEILTNYHVIEGIRGGEAKIEVKTADGRSYPATILGKDKELDIALVKIDAHHLPFAELGDSESSRIGEWVVAIGNPLGLDHTVTQGIISAKGRSGRLLGAGSGLESFIQTDAAINRGNSGGPLLNLKGQVIGINTAINPAGQNIGFAVPINMVKRIIKDLRSGKPVSRGYLGVTPQELDKAFQDSLGVRDGVVIGDVQRGQAADKAGVQRLDVITSVDGQKIKSPDDLIAAIASRRAGETVKLGIIRDGKSKEVPVLLGDRKTISASATAEGDDSDDSAPQREESDGRSVNLEKTYGFKVEALSPANRHQFGIEEDRKGVVVTYVSPRSPAADLRGFAPGIIVSAVGTKNIEGIKDFQAEVKKANGRPLLLLLRSPRGAGQTTVAVAPR